MLMTFTTIPKFLNYKFVFTKWSLSSTLYCDNVELSHENT